MRVRLYGALDDAGARAMQAEVMGLPWGPQGDLLLDVAGVDVIDEDGLGALLFLGRRLAAQRHRLLLTGVRGSWLARLRDLGLADTDQGPPGAAHAGIGPPSGGRAARGRGRDCIACRRPARGPEGD